ncbi:MAG TPA: hypothetical protein RMG48_22330 [Myxococcales bacterium LLY-WYZ-16_1]|nr:hypothetical protein [Myxococcales bacterium LLY-WYZ-16_1]
MGRRVFASLGAAFVSACGATEPPLPAIREVVPARVQVDRAETLQIRFDVPPAFDAAVRYGEGIEADWVSELRLVELGGRSRSIELTEPTMRSLDRLEGRLDEIETPGEFELRLRDGLGRDARWSTIAVVSNETSPEIDLEATNDEAWVGDCVRVVIESDQEATVRLLGSNLGVATNAECIGSDPEREVSVRPGANRVWVRGRSAGDGSLRATSGQEVAQLDFEFFGILSVEAPESMERGDCIPIDVLRRVEPAASEVLSAKVDVNGPAVIHADEGCEQPARQVDIEGVRGRAYAKATALGRLVFEASAPDHTAGLAGSVAVGGIVEFRVPRFIGAGLPARVGVAARDSDFAACTVTLGGLDGSPAETSVEWSTPDGPWVWLTPSRTGTFRLSCWKEGRLVALSRPVTVDNCDNPVRTGGSLKVVPSLGPPNASRSFAGMLSFSHRGGWLTAVRGLSATDAGDWTFVPPGQMLPFLLSPSGPGRRRVTVVLRDGLGCPVELEDDGYWANVIAVTDEASLRGLANTTGPGDVLQLPRTVTLSSDFVVTGPAPWVGEGRNLTTVRLQDGARLIFDGRRPVLSGLTLEGAGTVVLTPVARGAVLRDLRIEQAVRLVVRADDAVVGPKVTLESKARPALVLHGGEVVDSRIVDPSDVLGTEAYVEVGPNTTPRVHRTVWVGAGSPWLGVDGAMFGRGGLELWFNLFLDSDPSLPTPLWVDDGNQLELSLIGNVLPGVRFSRGATPPSDLSPNLLLDSSANLLASETSDAWCAEAGFECEGRMPYDGEGRFTNACDIVDRVEPTFRLNGYDKSGAGDPLDFHGAAYDVGPAEVPLSPGVCD